MADYRNKIILITGAAGSIGSALARRLAKSDPAKLIILDQNETGIFDVYEEIKDVCRCEYVIGDIRDKDKMVNVFNHWRPHLVFHAAAYKHVALMERWPDEAYKTNVEGLKNVVEAATECGTEKFVFISSDKAVNPSSVMGKTKQIGEEFCLSQEGKTKFIVVRFGNILASRGSVVEIFKKLIAKEVPLTVVKNMKRFAMGIYEAIELVLKASRLGQGGEIFIFDMGKQIEVEDLAKMMIRLSGKDLGIRYIEAKKGEKFFEELMTKKERKVATKQDNLWIIRKGTFIGKPARSTT